MPKNGHRHRVARRRVALGDVAAGPQGDAHGRGIAVADHPHVRRRLLATLVGHALGADAPRAVAAERQGVGNAGALDARNRARQPQDLVEIRRLLLGRRVGGVGIDAHGGGAGGLKAQVDVQDLHEAANEQPGADQQDARKRNLRHDQCVAHPPAGAPFGRSAAAILERVVQGQVRRLERGGQAEDDAGQERRGQREAKDCGVHTDRAEQGDADTVEPRERPRAGHREHQAEHGPRPRQHEAFGQHLDDQATASRTHRRTDGHLLLPGRRARQQEVGEVGAHDQHHHANRADKHPQGEAHPAAHLVGERGDAALKAVALWMRFGQLLAKQRHLGLCGRDRDAGLEPADHRHGVAPAIGLLTEREREVQVEAPARRKDRREVERLGQHARHRVGLGVEGERRADDGGVAVEAALPEGVAEQYRLGTVELCLVVREGPADDRPDAQHVEEVAGHRHAADPLGLAASAEYVVADPVEREVAGQRLERLRALLQVQQVAHLRGLPRQAGGIVIGDPDQPIGLRKGQRPQQQGVDYAEDRGAGADAEAGNQDGKGGKRGVSTQGAEREAEVLPEVGIHASLDGSAPKGLSAHPDVATA